MVFLLKADMVSNRHCFFGITSSKRLVIKLNLEITRLANKIPFWRNPTKKEIARYAPNLGRLLKRTLVGKTYQISKVRIQNKILSKRNFKD